MIVSERLRLDLEDISVSLASKGRLGGRLPPHLWGALRQRLQSIYRLATGEPHATIIVVDNPEAE